MKIIKNAIWSDWREWFAWHPVKTEDEIWVWLEVVERKLTEAKIPNVQPSSWTIYRLLNN